MRPLALALLLVTACVTGPAPIGVPLRETELARVRCLLVLPLENTSDVPKGAEVATHALLAGVDSARVHFFPVAELRALFQEASMELPEGIPPSLAVDLGDVLGADTVLYGSVEGRLSSKPPSLLVTLRLQRSEGHDLIFATSAPVIPIAGETSAQAVKRTVEAFALPVLSRLGGDMAPAGCFDAARSMKARATMTRSAAPARPAQAEAPNAAATPAAASASAATGTTAVPAAADPSPVVPVPLVASRRAAPTKTKGPRQADWARRLASSQTFVVEGVAFEGRTARLGRAPGLADLAAALASVPEVSVRLEGFVDKSRDSAADAGLSTSMAEAAARQLVAAGVPRSRLTIQGRGGEKPLMPNLTARGRAANRRLEATGLR